jgi:hypothetical protein
MGVQGASKMRQHRVISALLSLQPKKCFRAATKRNNIFMAKYYSPCITESNGNRQLFGGSASPPEFGW